VFETNDEWLKLILAWKKDWGNQANADKLQRQDSARKHEGYATIVDCREPEI
jgi:hypothetical protein